VNLFCAYLRTRNTLTKFPPIR